MKGTLLILFFLCIHLAIMAQLCGTDEQHNKLWQTDTSYRQKLQKIQQEVSKILQQYRSQKTNDAIYSIPVVVHIINLGEPVGTGSNITDTQVQSAINGMNQRFANSTGAGVNAEINFCLATRDPNGCSTTGIVRVNGAAVTGYQANGVDRNNCGGANEYLIKNLSKWPVSDYYNIWVVTQICGVAGFAYYPTGDSYDGTMIAYNYMNASLPTLAHEVAHGFYLAHTFNGENNGFCPTDNDCMLEGDWICDTPPHRSTDCGTGNPCSVSGVWDNSRKNYMSYCSAPDRFTAGQKARMRATLLVYPRASLLSSQGCTPTNFGTVITKTNATCNGNCNGSITVNPACAGTYTYAWNTGATIAAISSLCAGNYAVNITNTVTNETANINITITQPDPLNISLNRIQPCTGSNNGSAGVTVTGGTPFLSAPFSIIAGTGTGTFGSTEYPNPYGNAYWGAKHQLLFEASELHALGFNAGKILSAALNIAALGGGTYTYNNFQLKAGTTANTSLTAFQTGLTTVFGPQSIDIATGWNTYNFNTPFSWDGISNIIIEICFNNTSVTANSITYYTPRNSKDPSVVYARQNTNDVCSNSSAVFTDYKRPNMRFTVRKDSTFYNYAWSNGQTAASVTTLTAGSYSISVTDANNCSSNISFDLIAANTWTGTVNTAWENPGNWSCGIIPGANTDVIINSGSVVINSNVSCRTLDTRPGVQLTITPGNTLTLTR
jgi:hypothetical protein